jgi:hypothetical protein
VLTRWPLPDALRIVAAVGVGLVVIAVVAAVARPRPGSDETRPPLESPGEAEPTTTEAWKEWTTGGYRIAHPPAWHATSARLTAVLSPTDLLSIATFDFAGITPTSASCDQWPQGAIERIGDGDALVTIIGPFSAALRDTPLSAGTISSVSQGVPASDAIACARNRDRLTSHVLEFRAGEHVYLALVALDKAADRHIEQEALTALNSFTPLR